MKTKTIFKALAFAMMMPAMLLTTACSSNDDSIINNGNTNKKSQALPLTVNVNRQGDNATTRATYNGSTGKLSFSSGDKLFVEGEYGDWQFAGTLVWGTGDTFSGNIIVDDGVGNDYTGTAIQLLQDASTDPDAVRATLLPNGYDTNFLHISNEGYYNASLDVNYKYAFASTKKEAVEQFSYETAKGYSDGFSLIPQSAILSFTINGLKEVNSTINVSLAYDFEDDWKIDGSVTTDASGTATFAMALPEGENMDGYTLTVGDAELEFGSKTLVAGHISNIKMVALYELLIDGKTLYYSVGETWKEAINNHDNDDWSVVDNKVYFNDGDEYMLKSGGNPVAANDDVINPSGSYTLEQLLRVYINYNCGYIYFCEGETWQEAIDNHRDDNSDWSYGDNKVYGYNNNVLKSGGNFVEPNSVIDKNGGYTSVELLSTSEYSFGIEIYFRDGETWQEAIYNYPSKNPGWSYDAYNVLYDDGENQYMLMDDDSKPISPNATIEEYGDYHLE